MYRCFCITNCTYAVPTTGVELTVGRSQFPAVLLNYLVALSEFFRLFCFPLYSTKLVYSKLY